VAVPLLVITPIVTLFNYSFEHALFFGILLSSMSTSITAQVKLELGVLQRREGITLLGAALVDDAVVILLLSLFLAINPGGIIAVEESRPIFEVFVRIVGFVVIGTGISWVLLPRLANWVSRLRITEGPLIFAIVATFTLSYAAEAIGGVAGLAIATKVVGAGGGSLLGGFERRSALRVGVGMISRGEVGLIIASIGVGFGILQPTGFTAIVFVVLVTTLITPPLVRWSFSEPVSTSEPSPEETPTPA
jgi:Kef-type K+ transport system membrane component KefB